MKSKTLKTTILILSALSALSAKAENTYLPDTFPVGVWLEEQAETPQNLRNMISIREDGLTELRSSFYMTRNPRGESLTICSIIETGKLLEIAPIDETRKSRYRAKEESTENAPTHTLRFVVHNIHLTPDVQQDPFCVDYVDEKKNLISKWGLSFTREIDITLSIDMKIISLP